MPTEEGVIASQDGWPVWYVEDEDIPFPSYKRAQQSMDPNIARQLAEKISDNRMKNYISPSGVTTSDIDHFAVPKVVDDDGVVQDIRVVYNGTSCGLNQKLYAPNFWMPNIGTPLRALSFGYWRCDFDMGEFFLNFVLQEELRKFCGVRLEVISKFLDSPTVFDCESWTRCLFGLCPSPFWTIKLFYHADKGVRGDRLDENNPMRWDYVVLNLPGSSKFDPRLPWVMKWDANCNAITG